MWDAQTFGLVFGIWDYEWILENVPPHMMTHWQARFLITPPDAANRKALGQMKYEPPGWVQDMLEKQRRREKARSGKKKYLTGRDILRQFKRSRER